MFSEGRGTLYLLPNTLGDASPEETIPAATLHHARTLDYIIAEDPKTARAFLKRIAPRRPLQSIRVERLDHNTPENEIPALLDPLLAGSDAGLLSEAGLPAVADPGSNLVRLAHDQGVRVVPLSGPSSLLLALAASGLDGQRFAFHGYLPAKPGPLATALRTLERQSLRDRQTQIFIETPYRNDRTLATLLGVLRPGTALCLASDLTLPTETVRTRKIADWRRQPIQLKGRPTVFLFLA
jgi:16S rRNA (cytidine1402-2'-O)-methyltransferase